MKRMHSYIRLFVLAMSDAACMFCAWTLSVWFYWFIGVGSYPEGPFAYMGFWPAIPVFIVLNAVFRLYNGRPLNPAAPVPPVEEFRRLVVSAVLTHVGVITYIALSQQTIVGVSRFVIVVSGVLTALAAQPVRDVARWSMRILGVGQIPVLFVGGGEAADRLEKSLESDSHTGFVIVRRFRDGEFGKVSAEGRRLGVHTLVACLDIRILQCWIEEFSRNFTHIEYVVPSKTFPVLGARVVSFCGAGGLEMVNQRRMRLLRVEKFVLDKTLAIAAFLLLLPAFLIIPVLIKATSRGPVFYRHERLGKGGRRIWVWKFRSMYYDADSRLERVLSENHAARLEWESSFKLKNDPRVTPIGRFLRKTSLDELPQLFNVLSGEMALVGPRPIVEMEKPYYGDRYALLSSVMPGMTGLWQVSGRSDTGYVRRVTLDVSYVLNWSPWLDVWILFRTVVAVVLMRGAR